LTRLTQLVEHQRGGVTAAVLLLRDERPYHAVAPGLPHEFTRALDNGALRSESDFFSLAVLSPQPVIVADIAADARWDANRELAAAHGLGACWALPLRSGDGTPLGSFVV